MIKLEKNKHEQLYNLYLSNRPFFPLIASVLLDEQDGIVYVDDSKDPSQIYVEHVSGFSQVFGKEVACFEKSLENYLITDKIFNISKIRLYTPNLPIFINSPKYKLLCSTRQRFNLPNNFNVEDKLHEANTIISKHKLISVSSVDLSNVVDVKSAFDGIVTRFWRTEIDFIKNSLSVVVYIGIEPVSICYAAATAGKYLEIDVFTLPKYRNLGLSKFVVLNFIKKSLNLGMAPLWDCFTNNIGSMKLCQSIGFVANNEPYPLYTIDKVG